VPSDAAAEMSRRLRAININKALTLAAPTGPLRVTAGKVQLVQFLPPQPMAALSE
jgi:hypothetical protein